MSRHRVLVFAAASLWAYACGGDGATEPPPPEPPRATTVTVTPATAELGAENLKRSSITVEVRSIRVSSCAAARPGS